MCFFCDAAGESVGSKIAEKQKEMMREQLSKQLSMQMAAQREQLNWEFGSYGFFASVLVLAKLAKQHVPRPVAVPFVLAPIIMAYQVDFAYGDKADRIKKEADKILVRMVLCGCGSLSSLLFFLFFSSFLFYFCSSLWGLNRLRSPIGSQSHEEQKAREGMARTAGHNVMCLLL